MPTFYCISKKLEDRINKKNSNNKKDSKKGKLTLIKKLSSNNSINSKDSNPNTSALASKKYKLKSKQKEQL